MRCGVVRGCRANAVRDLAVQNAAMHGVDGVSAACALARPYISHHAVQGVASTVSAAGVSVCVGQVLSGCSQCEQDAQCTREKNTQSEPSGDHMRMSFGSKLGLYA